MSTMFHGYLSPGIDPTVFQPSHTCLAMACQGSPLPQLREGRGGAKHVRVHEELLTEVLVRGACAPYPSQKSLRLLKEHCWSPRSSLIGNRPRDTWSGFSQTSLSSVTLTSHCQGGGASTTGSDLLTSWSLELRAEASARMVLVRAPFLSVDRCLLTGGEQVGSRSCRTAAPVPTCPFSITASTSSSPSLTESRYGVHADLQEQARA